MLDKPGEFFLLEVMDIWKYLCVYTVYSFNYGSDQIFLAFSYLKIFLLYYYSFIARESETILANALSTEKQNK